MQQDELLRRATDARKAAAVPLHFFVFRKPRQGIAHKSAYGCVRRDYNAVMHPLTLTPGSHQPAAPKEREMAGDRRLRKAEHFDEVADAHFAVSDEVQEAQARAVGKGGKPYVGTKRIRHAPRVAGTYSRKQICTG